MYGKDHMSEGGLNTPPPHKKRPFKVYGDHLFSFPTLTPSPTSCLPPPFISFPKMYCLSFTIVLPLFIHKGFKEYHYSRLILFKKSRKDSLANEVPFEFHFH